LVVNDHIGLLLGGKDKGRQRAEGGRRQKVGGRGQKEEVEGKRW